MARKCENSMSINGRLTPTDEVIETDMDGGVVGEDGTKAWEEYLKKHPEAKKEFEDNAKKSEASDYIFCYWDY
jgi:hypothetical protein